MPIECAFPNTVRRTKSSKKLMPQPHDYVSVIRLSLEERSNLLQDQSKQRDVLLRLTQLYYMSVKTVLAVNFLNEDFWVGMAYEW